MMPPPGVLRRLSVEVALATTGFALALAHIDAQLVAAVLAALYGGRVVLRGDRAQRVVFFGFGTIWALVDVGFVSTGVFAYSEPSIVGPPSYMPLVFGQLALVVGAAVGWIPPARERVPLWLDVVLLALATGAVMLLHVQAPGMLTIAFLLGTAARAALARFSRAGITVALVFGVGEPLLEALLIRCGLFAFPRPSSLFGLPLWYGPFFAFVSFGVARAFPAAMRALRAPPASTTERSAESGPDGSAGPNVDRLTRDDA
jgi:hypothetical protein